jgi:phosphoribosylaminoimidazole-succinocarboxamide synthase
MEILKELYSGKAKSVYTTDDADRLVLHFRDDTSAFDGEKTASLARKGKVNNKVNAFVMTKLEQACCPTTSPW